MNINILKSNQSNPPIIRQPRSLYVLFFAEMWDRFSFYGTAALLILYLIHGLSFSVTKANAFYGTYIALGFALPVLGGILADKLLGFQRAVILGAVCIIIGNALLAMSQLTMNIGLALSVCGMGLFKGNITSLVGKLYSEDDPRRDAGFTIFYVGMNLGAILGPIIYGFVALKFGWHYSFGISALCMLSGLVLFLIHRKNFTAINKTALKKEFFLGITANQVFYLLLGIFVFLISILFTYPVVANNLIGVYCSVVFCVFAIMSFKKNTLERKRILGLLFLNIIAVFYFACGLQTSSSLMLFIDRYIDHKISGIEIPASAFASLEPFFVILLAPFFASLWFFLKKSQCEPSVILQVALGSLLASASFGIFVLATLYANYSHAWYSLLWIVVGNMLLGAGELCIGPTIIAAIAKYSPQDMLGTLMGVSFMSDALAGYIGSLIANLSQNANYSSLNGSMVYSHVFAEIAIAMLVISFVVLMFFPILKRLFENKALINFNQLNNVS